MDEKMFFDGQNYPYTYNLIWNLIDIKNKADIF